MLPEHGVTVILGERENLIGTDHLDRHILLSSKIKILLPVEDDTPLGEAKIADFPASVSERSSAVQTGRDK